jgi:hypothetical protein
MNANTPFKLQNQSKTPDIILSGETVDQIMILLNNTIILARSQDGAMRPFIDPMPIIQIIGNAIQAHTETSRTMDN